jgi:hypothetical protein
MNRTTQGYILITASTLLMINNITSPIGFLASLLFLIANTIGLIIHKRKKELK